MFRKIVILGWLLSAGCSQMTANPMADSQTTFPERNVAAIKTMAGSVLSTAQTTGCLIRAVSYGLKFFDPQISDPKASLQDNCMTEADNYIKWFRANNYTGNYVGTYYEAGVPIVSTFGAQKSLVNCPSGWVCPPTPLYNSKIGIWYEPWFRNKTPSQPNGNWAFEAYQPVDVPTGVANPGPYYDSSDKRVYPIHFNLFRQMGINYLILDDTNGYFSGVIENSGGVTDWGNVGNISALVEYEQSLSPGQRIPFALAIGSCMWSGSWTSSKARVDCQQTETNYALGLAPGLNKKPDPSIYYYLDGAPLLVNMAPYLWTQPPLQQIAGWPGFPGYTSSNFSVRNATGATTPFSEEDPLNLGGYWGWNFEFPQYATSGSSRYEAIGVSPGANNSEQPNGAFYIDRENGNYFMRDWIRAIKMNPKTIVISAFNQNGDGNDIEPATPRKDKSDGREIPWTDAYGKEADYLYVDIAAAYGNLRVGLQDTVSYRDENGTFTYTVSGGRLFLSPTPPHGAPVVQLPAGTLQTLMGGPNPFVKLPPDGTLISSTGLPSGVMRNGELLRFEEPSVAQAFATTGSLTISSTDYQLLPYGGTINKRSAMYGAPGFPPLFVSDRGDAWPTNCPSAMKANSAPAPTQITVGRYGQFVNRGSLTCD